MKKVGINNLLIKMSARHTSPTRGVKLKKGHPVCGAAPLATQKRI